MILVDQRKYVFACVLAMSAASLYAPRASAQAVAVAEVDGHVTDPSGQSVAGAEIKMTETDKQQVHLTRSDPQGRYALPNLPTGSYRLEVSAQGFKSYVQTGIVLQVNNNVEANVQMQIGSVSESIQVEANAAMVETKENAISQVIDQRRIVDLPLNGRNPTQMITLTGAATSTPAGDLTGSKNIQGSNGSGTFSVAGGQANGLSYLLDGGDNNDAFSNVNLPLPFPDALQEFSVVTSALPAQYGLHPGGVVNAVTRSGSNTFHGDLFEFLRNGDFNARQKATAARDTLRRSQYGGVAGGHILKDKLFYFGGYQGTRQRSNPPSTISYVPTAASLDGDFSVLDGLQSSGGCLTGSTKRQLTNPFANGAPFPNNQIPTSLFDPAALKLVKAYIPVSSDPCGKTQYGIPANNPDDQWIGRMDYVVSEKHNMYGRYYIYDYTAETTFNGTDALTTTAAGNQDRSQTMTFGDTYTFTPTLLNSFHATFDRRRDNRGAAPNLFSPVSLGVNMFNLLPNFINLTVTNYFAVGCGTCAPGFFNANNYQLSDDVNWIRGRHQMAFGVDVRKEQLNIANNQQVNGQFTFSGSVTGDALADFLLGRVSSFTDGNPNPNALRETVFAAYAQDTFRARNNLTLNFGLRWEPIVPPYDKYDRGNQFSLAAFDAGQHSTVYPNAPAGLLFTGDAANKNGKYFNDSHYLTFSPRIGLVWDVNGDGKQTVRAAFALMHDVAELFFPERLTTNPPYASSVTINNSTVGIPFSNPYQGYAGGNPFPGAAIFPAGGTYVSMPPGMKPTYMMQWNLSYQRQVAKDWLVTANYLGNKTVHIWGAYDINPSIPIAGSSAATNQRRLLYLQNPAQGALYSSIVQADDGGNSKYNGLLTSLQHRFSNHYTLLANYTWSHCISDIDFQGELAGPLYQNPNSRSSEKGSCIYDHRSIFNLSAVANSGGFGNSLTKLVTEGWQVGPVFTASSGAPLTLTDGGKDISLSGQLLDRPNVVSSNVYSGARTASEWFNTSAFAIQPTGTFGNVGRDSLNSPGNWNIDVTASRDFKIHERLSLQVRGDAFNVINHANWTAPQAAITSATFGQITTFSSPRIIQLAMKLIY